MSDYAAPLRDMRYVLNNICDINAMAGLPAFEHATSDIVDAVLEEAGRFTSEVVAPSNAIGDAEGATLKDGVVTTTTGYKDIWSQYVEGGWASLPFPEQYGGQNLPFSLAMVLSEMMASSNVAFMLLPTLSAGATEALLASGSDDLLNVYAEKMISGEWSGAMQLTESHSGSDLGTIRSKAEPQADGSYKISGTKIFITWGDHDCADNVIHLVLARTPDAPAGSKGISCFVVPKYLVNEDGSLGARNDVWCTGLEHKLGIHSSPTCTMTMGDNGGATGYLLGEENKGMKAMFIMMNNARLQVGIQGLGVGERAYQKAVSYALDRKQGRTVTGDETIIGHPDVRRMLMTMKASVEASRAICYRNAAEIDLAHHAATPEERALAASRAALLTPLAKAYSTDMAVDIASIGIQVHGGMGFVEETGAAQHYRDARILPIYEGTNGIQSIDLVTRKLTMDGGNVMKAHLADFAGVADALKASGDDRLVETGAALAEGVEAAVACTDYLLGIGAETYADALGAASPYLKVVSLVTGAGYLGKLALAAKTDLEATDADAGYLNGKITTARFFATQLLPQAHGHKAAVLAGAKDLFDIAADQLLTA